MRTTIDIDDALMRKAMRLSGLTTKKAVVEAALRAGVGIDAVGPYRIASPGPGGLIFGYATASEEAIAEGVDILARVISQF